MKGKRSQRVAAVDAFHCCLTLSFTSALCTLELRPSSQCLSTQRELTQAQGEHTNPTRKDQAGVGTMNLFAGWQENLTTAPVYKPTTM